MDPQTTSGPVIAVVAYNRPLSLRRLLRSLSDAVYPGGVEAKLVISIDRSDVAEVAELARAFAWPHGEKIVIEHPENLGLRPHILACGDLSQTYGAVIVLEDDLVVAPHFYEYALKAVAFYEADPGVGGIALYNYRLSEFYNIDFEPIADGSDVYFLQIAASSGQCWTAAQWAGFRAWYAEKRDEPILEEQGLPKQLESWKTTSWKKYYIKYLIERGLYFAYPRFALSTNSGDAGTHIKRDVGTHEVPLDLGRRNWQFRALAESMAIYDAFYEIRPEALKRLAPRLADVDLDVDIWGNKPDSALRRGMVLSSRPCAARETGFALQMLPAEANVVFDVRGDFISLAPRSAFGPMTSERRMTLVRHANLHTYWNRYLFQFLKPIQTRLRLLLSKPR